MPRAITLPTAGDGRSSGQRPLSSSMGAYLEAIWAAAGTGTTPTKEIAGRLSVSSASVTNMFVRLREEGLVEYERYHGVSLTRRGCMEALKLVRRHRLLKTFLIEHLGYSWEEACQETRTDEYLTSERFTERLGKHLGHPLHDPQGDPIPQADGTLPPEDSYLLSEATAGQHLRIRRVSDDSASRLDYLWERGLVPGRELEVTETRTLDGVVTVEDEDGISHVLGRPLARAIFVQGVSEPAHG